MVKCELYFDGRNLEEKKSIKIYIYLNKTCRLYWPTGIIVDNSDIKNGVITGKSSLAKSTMVNNILLAVQQIIVERQNELNNMTLSMLKKILSKKFNSEEKTNKLFIDYLDEFVSLKASEGTKTIYRTTKNKILAFDSKCVFETIDKKWLTTFENWMAQTMKVNAYAIHLRNVRAVFNYAIDEEYTSLYPFRKFKIKKEETRKRSLTVEQLAILRDYPCEKHQERYRDIFMLMFYLIGVNAVDLFNAKELVNGRLEYKRAKTGKLYSIKVEPEAMVIIEKYRGANHLLNILDEYSNYKDFLHRMGIELKNIGEVKRVGLGGKKERTPLFPELSSYWARHSWATTAAELDIPKETISEALGHEIGSAVTSIYIKFDKKKVDVANRKVIDCLSNQEKEEE